MARTYDPFTTGLRMKGRWSDFLALAIYIDFECFLGDTHADSHVYIRHWRMLSHKFEIPQFGFGPGGIRTQDPSIQATIAHTQGVSAQTDRANLPSLKAWFESPSI